MKKKTTAKPAQSTAKKKTARKAPSGPPDLSPLLERPLPDTLPQCREEIDRVDEAIISLLDRRAQIARRVGEVKARTGVDAFDAGRHLQVLNGISRRGTGDFPREGLRHVFGEILSACLNLQAVQTIAFLGPEATFTHIAARRVFGASPRFVPYETIADIFLAVEKGWAHFGVAPVENSTGGVIHATLDELMNSELRICAEIFIPIQHNLLSKWPKEEIEKICTHPQIFSQCRIWLRENLPGVRHVEVPSSGEGARMAQNEKGVATIGSQMASEIYRLPIVEEGIEDQKDNITRFLVIGSQLSRPSGNDRTSVMFSIKDEPGALYHLLKPFADRRINMTKIESRPTRQRAWDYIFFVDIQGHIEDPKIAQVVDKLRRHCTMLRVLGSYPIDEQPKITGR